jgi:hypothetical protein
MCWDGKRRGHSGAEKPSAKNSPLSGLIGPLSADAKRKRRIGQRKRRHPEHAPICHNNDVLPVTQSRYRQAYEETVQFAKSFLYKHETMEEVDRVLDKFCDHAYRRGDAPGSVRLAIYGSIWVMQLAKSSTVFPLAKRALKGFLRMCPENVRDSPCIEMVWLLTGRIVTSRFAGDLSELVAIGCWLRFDCYLRGSELLELSTATVTAPRGRDRQYILTIAPQGGKPAKNKEYDASVIVGHNGRDWLNDALRRLCASARQTASKLLFAVLTLPLL